MAKQIERKQTKGQRERDRAKRRQKDSAREEQSNTETEGQIETIETIVINANYCFVHLNLKYLQLKENCFILDQF